MTSCPAINICASPPWTQPLPSTPTRNKQVPPRNKYRNRWTSALPKWVPKRPVKFCLPKNSMAWRMKRYVYTARYQSDASNKTNKTPDFFLPYFRTWCLAMKLQEIDVICPQMGKVFSTFLLKKTSTQNTWTWIFRKLPVFICVFQGFLVGLTKNQSSKTRIECCFGIREACRFGSHKGSNDGTHLGGSRSL